MNIIEVSKRLRKLSTNIAVHDYSPDRIQEELIFLAKVLEDKESKRIKESS